MHFKIAIYHEMNSFTQHIAKSLNIPERSVDNTLELLNEGCTIPFISRYRKERTGNLDEVRIAEISNMNEKLSELQKRKDTIIKTIEDQDKMTPELKGKILALWSSTELEDLYLPYKPKRRTRAQVAREAGLEPLATLLLMQRENNPKKAAERYVKGDIKDVEAAIKGAQDIIAEMISEDQRSRQQMRNVFSHTAMITSKVIKTKKDLEEAQKYSDYFDWSEPLKRCSSHRLLAMRRGENDGILRVSITADEEQCIERLDRIFVRGDNDSTTLVEEAVDDSFKRLLAPSIETEFAAISKDKADEEAIKVFAENLRQLLLSAPLGQKRVIGIDPGFRTGCKVVCLDAQGNLLHHTVLYLSNRQGGETLMKLVLDYKTEAFAIGNGTASRETTDYIKSLEFERNIDVFVVSEDGASVYSASEAAREEFPDKDVTVRGAVSIGRRLMDPLAELVKITPKSIGVGQYQHDVDQAKLKKSLDQTVESCVNMVGVDVNTASQHLLTYVSGLGAALGKNIVEYRKTNGPFKARSELKKVPRLGPVAYLQCAGFLRIGGGKNPLDNSAVHPESYHIVEQMAKDQNCSVAELMASAEKRKNIDAKRYISGDIGLPTINDILKELEKPGRDPRQRIEVFEFDPNVKTPADLIQGMILPGIVTNITNFGAFIDIGVHQDGLVHISQLADGFVKDPNEVVHLHQHVKVRVMEVDNARKRISLSMKGVK